MQKGFGAIFIFVIALTIGAVALFAIRGLGNKNFPDRIKDLGGGEDWE